MRDQFISIISEILTRQVHPFKKDILQTLNKDVIKRFGRLLELDNLKIYTYSITGRNIQEWQIIGNNIIWDVFNVEKIKKDFLVRDKKTIIKIKYSTDDGRIITAGFLGAYKEKGLTDEENNYLKLLCLQYGDYIQKRVSLTVKQKIRQQLATILKYGTQGGLPGTIIVKCQACFHRGFNAYSSYYCVIDHNKLYVDYYKKENDGYQLIERPGPIFISNELLLFLNQPSVILRSAEAKAQTLFDVIKKFDKSIDSDFIFFIYPTKEASNIIGCWIFTFSNRQYFDRREFYELIELVNPLVQNNYKYLYQRATKKMIVDPIFKSRDTRIDIKKVFVLMPFSLDWSDRVWQKMIKPVIEELGLTAIRADDLYGHDLMEDIWKGILSSNFVIADITGRNPNVFYELGVAHTLGKKVILLTQNQNDIPFDLNRYRHIIYQDNVDGFELLKRKLNSTIKELLM